MESAPCHYLFESNCISLCCSDTSTYIYASLPRMLPNSHKTYSWTAADEPSWLISESLEPRFGNKHSCDNL